MNAKICARVLVVSLLFQFAIVPAGVFAVPADTAVTLTASTPSGTSDTVPTSETAMPAVVPSNQNTDSASGSVAATAGSSQSPAPVTESTVPETPAPVVSAAPAVETTLAPSATAQTAPSVAPDASTPSAPLPTTPTAPVVDDVTPTAEKTVTAPAAMLMAAVSEATNLIQNPSLETANGSLPKFWSKEKWGTSTVSFTYPVTGHTGDKAAKITMSGYKSGDAKWYFDAVPVTPSTQYVFSDWYQSTAKTWVVAQYTTSTGSIQYVDFGSMAASAAWKQYTKTFTVPAGMTAMTVLHLIKANGTLTVDDYSLTSSASVPNPAPTLTLAANPTSVVSGSSSTLTWSSTDATSCSATGGWTSSTATSGSASATPSTTTTYSMTCTGAGGTVTKTATVTVTTPTPETNLILNPSLETANGSLPANWSKNNWGALTPAYAYPVAGHTGSKAAQITVTGFKSGDAKWFFSDVAVTPGAEYVFTGWYKSNVQTDVTVRYTSSTGAVTYADFGTVPVASSWTKYTKTFTVPAGVTSLTIFHLIRTNGRLTVDDYSLVQSPTVDTSAFAEGMLTFAFDDGFLNTYQNGVPILDAAGIQSTQAVITGAFGDAGYVTAAQVQDMVARGHEVASHTRTHADLTTLSTADAQTEIAGSKADLAAIGVTANTIVYPFGTYNDSVVTQVKNAGYVGARSVDTGYDTPNTNPYALRDQHVTSDVTFDQIKGWIDTAIANKQWLVLELHQQQAGAGEYSNDPALLQQVANYVKAQGMKTVTLGQGVALMK